MQYLLGNWGRWDPQLGRTQRSKTGHHVPLLNQSTDLRGCAEQLAPETAWCRTACTLRDQKAATLGALPL